MPIIVTNSLTQKREILTPLAENTFRMYVCGPTVYNLIHVGNARPFVFFDVVRRYLLFKGFSVKYVLNITDVDDKIIQKARQEKSSASDISKKYTLEFQKDFESLGLKAPDQMPKV